MYGVLEQMRARRIGPGETSYRFLLTAFARFGLAGPARHVFTMMGADGIHPNAITTGLFVKAVLGEQNRKASHAATLHASDTRQAKLARMGMVRWRMHSTAHPGNDQTRASFGAQQRRWVGGQCWGRCWTLGT
jgi:hypothetical protein